MEIQILKCRNCGMIFSVDLKRKWFKKCCTKCNSKDTEIIVYDVKNL